MTARVGDDGVHLTPDQVATIHRLWHARPDATGASIAAEAAAAFGRAVGPHVALYHRPRDLPRLPQGRREWPAAGATAPTAPRRPRPKAESLAALPRSYRSPRPGASPITSSVEYDDDQLEYLRALDRFKAESHKPFPTECERLAVLKSLGYRKVSEADRPC